MDRFLTIDMTSIDQSRNEASLLIHAFDVMWKHPISDLVYKSRDPTWRIRLIFISGIFSATWEPRCWKSSSQ